MKRIFLLAASLCIYAFTLTAQNYPQVVTFETSDDVSATFVSVGVSEKSKDVAENAAQSLFYTLQGNTLRDVKSKIAIRKLLQSRDGNITLLFEDNCIHTKVELGILRSKRTLDSWNLELGAHTIYAHLTTLANIVIRQVTVSINDEAINLLATK